MPQPQPRQQSRFNEIQMLQRQIMFKQLQELQRQQQSQELGDSRQHDYANHQSVLNKQVSGAHFSPLINGMPVRDASQMFMFGDMNAGQHGTSPVIQGYPHGLVFPHAHSQALRSMGLASQKLEGTPIASSGNSSSQYSHLQGASHYTAGMLTEVSTDQAEKSFINDQCDSSNRVSTPDGACKSNQVLHEKSLFSQAVTQNLDRGVRQGNLSETTNLQRNDSLQQHDGGRQEQGGFADALSGQTTDIDFSNNVDSLDPLERKILFNMDDNSWGASFGTCGNMTTTDNMLEQTYDASTFPSVQSGSWSALMQSAVAEASSSDTGVQEEWSGLSFQNQEVSNDKQPSNFVGSGNQQSTKWLDNNLHTASKTSPMPELMCDNGSLSFPVKHNSGFKFPFQQEDDLRSDSSPDSMQQPQHIPREWLSCNAQAKSIEGCESAPRFSHSQTAWPVKDFEQLESDINRQSLSAKMTRNIESHSLTGRENFQVAQGLSSSEQGRVGELGSRNNGSSVAMGFNKGFLPGIQNDFRPSEVGSTRTDGCSNAPAFVNRSAGSHDPNMNSQTSQNELKLFHKAENLTECRPETYYASRESTAVSEVPQVEQPEGSFAQSYKRSCSESFGSNLASPSQRQTNSGYVGSFPTSPKLENSATPFRGPLYDNQLHSHMPAVRQSPQATLAGVGSKFNPATSQETSHPISADPYTMKPPNIWVDVPSQHNQSGLRSHPSSASDGTKSRLESSSGALKELDNQNYFKGGNSSQELGDGFSGVQESAEEKSGRQMLAESLPQSNEVSHGLGFHDGHVSETNASASGSLGHVSRNDQVPAENWHGGNQSAAVSVGDLDAFGSSLNSIPHPLHSDSGNRAVVKSERHNSFMKFHQSGVGTRLNPFMHQGYQSGSILGPSDDMERSQITFPMASSQFKNGTMINGEMLPMYGSRFSNDVAQHLSVGKPSESLHLKNSLAQVNLASGSVWPTAVANLVEDKRLSSQYILHPENPSQSLTALRLHKRKFSTYDLPWHKEVTGVSLKLHNVSTAELEWGKAVNRLPKRLSDEGEMIDRSLEMVLPKRRLILTTQLMQWLLRPAPAAILSGDAILHADTVAYFAARLALGDSCGLASHSHMSSDSSSGKKRSSEGDSDFSKIVANLIARSKKLEGDLLRSEKGVSVLDLKVELLELEKFSVFNRFAKFHGQAKAGAPLMTSSPATSSAPRLPPKRYVTAVPMPRTVPEGVRCVSL